MQFLASFSSSAECVRGKFISARKEQSHKRAIKTPRTRSWRLITLNKILKIHSLSLSLHILLLLLNASACSCASDKLFCLRGVCSINLPGAAHVTHRHLSEMHFCVPCVLSQRDECGVKRDLSRHKMCASQFRERLSDAII